MTIGSSLIYLTNKWAAVMEKIDIKVENTEEHIPSSKTESQNIIITDPLTDRYNTFGFISWWKQDVIQEAKVLVVGAGALGNEVLKNLALMGVGHILLVDWYFFI